MQAKVYYVIRTIEGMAKGEYLTDKGCTLDDSGCNCRHRGCAVRFETRTAAECEARSSMGEAVHRVVIRRVGVHSKRPLPYLVLRHKYGGYRTPEGKLTIDLRLAEAFADTPNERAVMHSKKRKGDCVVKIKASLAHSEAPNGRHICPEALS